MSPFVLATAGAWLLVVVLAAALRSRAYAMFRGVGLGLHALVATALWPRVGELWPLFVYLHATVFVRSALLVRPRMQPLAYRTLVSVPSAFFSAGTALAMPWAVGFALGFAPVGWWAPYLLAAIGVWQSLSARREVNTIVVADGETVSGIRRHRSANGACSERPLRIVQITDPHLGPFMSVGRLAEICRRAVEREPDLVLLTGDFLTMESQSDPAVLAGGLEPLRALEGKVFACLGNHDLEAPETVKKALADIGARLLIDEAALVETPAGRVQLVGADFRWRGREAQLRELCQAHPRLDGVLRLVLLHDPGGLRDLPEGEADLVLSGHTHGGQLGFVSLGLSFTLMRLFTRVPDHGLWARGTDRLYVHRGTGHYGFPLRLGVPAEESVLEVHRG
jgi:predicted MPP superfamily phosphohydrolase